MNYTLNTILCLGFLILISCDEQRYPDALAPEEALKSFQLREGFKIEVFAAEPEVMDPVEMVFDEQGNAYVAEMPDYPYMPEEGKGAGRIRVLQDTNGDGRIDKNIIFADSILEATSMLPWKGGLIVTAAPHILYLKDTNNDFRADETEILFSGFFENNSEAQITSLRFGIDNWIYAANNGQAGKVTFRRKPDAAPLSMSGADFRFRLDRGAFELESGGGQFGHTMDDWGNRFITQNTLHIRQVLIPWRYLHRHSNLPVSTSVMNISDHDLEMFQLTPPPYWRAERTSRRQQLYKEQNLDRVEYAEDHFTGSSGGTFYDGDGFPQEYYGNIFTGDVAGNLVHRDVLIVQDSSPAFVAKREEGEKTTEFLASTDSWFRPSGFTVGPDGFLYVIDMYRQHIETPLSIPEDLKEDMDFLEGSDRGRIYRILPANAAPGDKALRNLKAMSPDGYVKLLAHPNRWYRLQAQRLLLERQDVSVVPPVKDLLINHEDPRTRLHALYVLEGLNALDAALVSQAIRDVHPGMRKHGLILAERYPELLPQVLERVNDSSVHVVFQAALSAGEFRGQKVTDALANVAAKYGADRWMRTAVLSSEAGSSIHMFNTLVNLNFFDEVEPWKISFVEDLSFTLGSGQPKPEITRFLNTLKQTNQLRDDRWQIAGVKGLVKGLEKSEVLTPDLKEKLKDIQINTGKEADNAIASLRKFYAHL